jgi:hypothetical protein
MRQIGERAGQSISVQSHGVSSEVSDVRRSEAAVVVWTPQDPRDVFAGEVLLEVPLSVEARSFACLPKALPERLRVMRLL